MKTTLTDLQRKTFELLGPVLAGKGKLVVTEHGQPCLEISKTPQIDRKAALAALRRIGPVDLFSRK